MLGVADGRDDLTAAITAFHDLGRRMDDATRLWHQSWVERLDGSFELEAASFARPSRTRSPISPRSSTPASRWPWPSQGDRRGARGARARRGRRVVPDEAAQALAGARLDVADGRTDAALQAAAALEREVVGTTFFLDARSELLIECGVIAELAGDHETAMRRAAMALESAETEGRVALVREGTGLLAGDLTRL